MDVWAHFAKQAPDLSHETPLETRERLTAEKARKWRLLCEEGHCRYRGVPASSEQGPGHDESDAEKCGGYVGIRRSDRWAWDICPWHRDWWNRHRAWKQAQKPQKKRGGYEEEC